MNSFVYKDRIKFDDWRTMQDFVDKKGFLYKFHVSQGYHHADIDEKHQKYLAPLGKLIAKLGSLCSLLYPLAYALHHLF